MNSLSDTCTIVTVEEIAHVNFLLASLSPRDVFIIFFQLQNKNQSLQSLEMKSSHKFLPPLIDIVHLFNIL